MNSNKQTSSDLRGLLFIGDPHLESRIPGFRKDDYPTTALRKFRWCLEFAKANKLQPFLLGDLFQLPQDNPNWLIGEIISVIAEFTNGSLPAIYGNHDVRENSLKPNDSINILFAGGHLQRVGFNENAWTGTVDGSRVSVSGTVWGDRVPKSVASSDDNGSGPFDLSILMTHHDILIPGYEESGRIRPKAMEGLDIVINGHVHRRLEIVSKKQADWQTHWVTAGNITRRARSDASRLHQPAVPCIIPNLRSQKSDAEQGQLFDATDHDHDWECIHSFQFESQQKFPWSIEWIEVPHAPFDEVFHPEVENEEFESETGSEFIKDLRELTQRRTDSGAGLTDYLKANLKQFEKPVADQVWKLAQQVADPSELSSLPESRPEPE